MKVKDPVPWASIVEGNETLLIVAVEAVQLCVEPETVQLVPDPQVETVHVVVVDGFVPVHFVSAAVVESGERLQVTVLT